jgi:hypothetical protein
MFFLSARSRAGALYLPTRGRRGLKTDLTCKLGGAFIDVATDGIHPAWQPQYLNPQAGEEKHENDNRFRDGVAVGDGDGGQGSKGKG